MVDRCSTVEHVTSASPFAILLRDILKVFQNAALQVVDLIEPFLKHKGGSLLASDASSTKHCYFAMLRWIQIFAHVGDKVRKSLDIWSC